MFLILSFPTSRTDAQSASLTVRGGERTIELATKSLADLSAITALDSSALRWQPARPGLHWLELQLSTRLLRLPIRAIVVRLDPKLYRFELQTATRPNRVSGAWTIDSAGSDAVFAVNAGQFKEAGPWGWLVRRGVEASLPGKGPLAVGIAFDTANRVRWIPANALNAARRDRSIVEAFQSYPALLLDGVVPPLARDSRRVEHNHRDARLIMAETEAGDLIFVLTRLDVLGRTTERVPIGLTLPESVLLVRALGARNAVMLDGGISAQMLVREQVGRSHAWPGFRAVPVGMVAVPR